MSVVRPSPVTRAPPLELLKYRVDCIVKEQDEMKAYIKTELETIQKQIKYLEDKLDERIDIYREHYHSMSSTSTKK